METKHTKGEWEVSTQGKNGIFILAKNPTDMGKDAVCRIYTENSHKHSSEANAKLIAAAPELLEALVELLNSTYPNYKSIDDSKHPANLSLNAIKKATE